MIVDKIDEIISFKQNKWLEKFENFITQNRSKAENEFEEDFYKLLKNAIYGKTMEIVRNCLRLKIFHKDDTKKIY